MAKGTTRRSGFGPGDLFLFGKFNLFQKDAHQRTFRLAGKLGLSLPTGADNDSGELGILPPALQRGTGSVNPSAMLIATRLWHRFGLNGGVGYTALTEAAQVGGAVGIERVRRRTGLVPHCDRCGRWTERQCLRGGLLQPPGPEVL